jgi:2-(1,2-epoxy-1,2-dihydrophenyl)acetyl-CoA isomerase
MSLTYERILYDVTDGIATVTLNFPEKRNAMRKPMVNEFGHALALAEHDPGVKAIILTGAGEHFSAGGDMSAATSGPPTLESSRARMQGGTRVARQLLELQKPLIAAVDGCAFGAGFSFALASDLIIASTRARFCLAFMRIGLMPDTAALFTLPRLIGLQAAKQLIYSARELSAAEALSLHLVLDVVEPEELMTRAREIARAMGSIAPTAFAVTKNALLKTYSSDLTTILDAEIDGQAMAFMSSAHLEAVQRMQAKEPPLFQWPTGGAGSR